MSRHDLFICSVGVVSPAGTGVERLVAALADPAWEPTVGLDRPDGPPLPVAVCHDFSPRNVLSPMVARRLDRPAKLLAVAAREALAAIGDQLPWDRTQVGITSGTWNAGTSALVDVLRAVFLTSPEEAPPAQFPSTVANAPASQLGILERLGGPNLTFAEKQASGLRAVIEGGRLLTHGRAAAILACGVDEADWLNAEGYARLGVLADAPGHTGMRMGEGAAVLILAPEPIGVPLARLAGWASSGTASEPWLYPDCPDALIDASRRALENAERAPTDVDLVLSLANGIPYIGGLELAALAEVFGDHRPAALSTNERLGEAGFASILRVAVAALVVAGRARPAWTPAPHLAAMGFPPVASQPRTALVTAVAGGGSSLAVVLTAV